jgi:hypothetical protein
MNDSKAEASAQAMQETWQVGDEIRDHNLVWQDFKNFSDSVDSLLRSMTDVYGSAKLVGTLVIVGGVLSLAITFIAVTPLISAEPHEIIALALLASVFIISGCLLYAFVTSLDHRTYIASQEIVTQIIPIIKDLEQERLEALKIHDQRVHETLRDNGIPETVWEELQANRPISSAKDIV